MRKNLAATVLMAGALLAIFYLTYHLHQTSKGKALSQFNEHQLHISQQTARQIESYFRMRFQDLRCLSSLAALQDLDRDKTATPDIQSDFERLKRHHISAISLLDEKGITAYSTTAGAMGANHSQTDFFTWARDPVNKGSIWIGYDKADGQRISGTAGSPAPLHSHISLVTPLYRESAGGDQQKPGGKFAGVIWLAADLEEMLTEQSILLTPQMKLHSLWIMDRDGMVLLQSEHPEMVMRNIRERDGTCDQCHVSFDYVEKMLGKAEGTTEYQQKGYPKKIAAFTSVSFANASWIVVANAPSVEVTAFIQTHFRDTLSILGILTFVLCLAFYSVYKNYHRRMEGEMEVRRLHDQKKLMEELQETRDYLEDLFDYANAPIIVWNPGFRITRFNRAFERLTGYSAGEVIGRELQMLFPEGSQDESLSLIARTLSGEYWESVEIPILRKDGNAWLALWNSANIYAADGTTLVATIAQGQDITEREQSERDRRHRIRELDVLYKISRSTAQSLNLHETLNNAVKTTIEALHVEAGGIFLMEPDGRTMTMRVHCGISDEFFRNVQKINFGEGISGRATAERKVIVLNVSDYPSERLAPFIVREGFRVLASVPLISSSDTIGALNLGMRHPHTFTPEEILLLEAIGQILGQAVRNAQLYESGQQELAERKKTAEELRETRDYMANLFGYANAPIIVWDREFKITRFNRAFERLTGHMAEEVIGKNLQILFPDSSRGESLAQIKSVLSGEYWESVEIPIHCKNGGIRTALWNSANIYAADGATLIATIAQGQDITERKQSEEKLLISENKYRQHFENASDVIFSYDQDFRVLDISPSVERILGYKPEEIIGKTLPELKILPSEYIEKAFSEVKSLFAGEHLDSTIYGFIARDGTRKYAEINATPLFVNGQVVSINCIARDITDRKLAEDKLRITQFAVDCAAESIAWVRKDGRYLYVNDVYCHLLDYSKDKFLSMKIYDLDPDISANSWPDHWAIIKQQGSHVFETSRLSKNGVFIPLEIHANYLAYGDEEFIVTFCRDIREQKRHEEQLKRQFDRLAALRSIDMAITASLDIRVTFSIFLEQVTANLGVDAAAILLLDSQSYNRLSYAAGRGFRTNALKHTNLSIGTGYAGRVAQERKSICIPDLQKEPHDLLRQSPELSSEGFITYHGVPLIAKGHVKGVLEVFNRTPFEPDQDWLDFLEALATQAAIAIDNAMLFDDLQKSNINLIQAYDSTLEGWSKALDLRDKETEGHSERVTETTLRLARQMGMTDSELLHVRRGALLHDIGKMGVPDGILLKPGPLNDEEWEIMRKHPVFAYQLLFPISHLRPALDIPYCHHEKWDGTGYPRGLKGEDIPLAARIFAIVDVWDAICSDRPYRPSWPEEKAHNYIKELTGKHFDPKVVEAFLDLLNALKSV